MNDLHLCPCLGYETFCELRRSVGWEFWAEIPTQTEKNL